MGAAMLAQSEVIAQLPEYWLKTYCGADRDWAYSIQQTSDGGYIVAGWTESFGAGYADFWALKLDETGSITDCPMGVDST